MAMTAFEILELAEIDGLVELKFNSFNDHRGKIWTTYNQKDLSSLLPDQLEFIHDKFTFSKKNVLRGIHGDAKSWKLVTCVYGKIYQVVIDLRDNSPTFKKWKSFQIGNDDNRSILIPPNFGNAFLVLSDEAVYHYKLAYHGDYFDAAQQFTYAWNDPSINIDWPCDNPILSSRDQ